MQSKILISVVGAILLAAGAAAFSIVRRRHADAPPIAAQPPRIDDATSSDAQSG